MLQNHREYRFIFVTIPLWLMLFSDFIAVVSNRSKNRILWLRATCACVALVSLLGIFNLIPFQEKLYNDFIGKISRVKFVHNQDPIFKIYRQLATDEKMLGLIDSTRAYLTTGGYYYLHHAMPFYDYYSWKSLGIIKNPEKYASHIIVSQSAREGKSVMFDGREVLQTEHGLINLPVFVNDLNANQLVYWDKSGRANPLSNYVLQDQFSDKEFSEITVWRAEDNAPVRKWKNYQIVISNLEFIRKKINQSLLTLPLPPPPKHRIEFADTAEQ